ncbi:hypothetical protein HFD88_007955 [Aspergillus terreus]|nr:hypothetical protein HFD88_007955 [Aspergillus terreus]
MMLIHTADEGIAFNFPVFQSGAEDEFTVRWNKDSWRTIRFRPRVLRPIRSIDLTTSILGTEYSVPFFICPAGGGKLAHPTGEVLLTQAAGKHGVLHWIYAMNDLSVTEKEIKQAIALGYRGFALTVDAIWSGKRERDVRLNVDDGDDSDEDQDEEENDGFASGPTVKRSPIWTEFDWPSSIAWLRKITNLPIAIKGIQSWEDAVLCMEYGVHPWLSNHGGRQLEGAPSAVDTLLAIRKHCPQVFDRCEVIVDGGITRGADIVKALALGARAVGLGRGFLYALAFGERGVSRAIRILRHEVETTMALLGVTNVGQLNPSYVDVSMLQDGLPFPRSHL